MIDRTERSTGFWLAISLLAAVGIVKVLNDTLDPDCFWHLRVAEQLQRDGIGPLVDDLSFASIKEPWTPYSWLAELGLRRLWDAGGYRAAVVTSGLLAGGFLLLVAMSCVELAGQRRRLNCIMGTALAACLSLPYLGFRPATAAILLLCICGWLLLRDRRLGETSRAVWLIVPITALLVNLHLTAVIVPLWVGCLLLGAIIERARRSAWRYALLLASSGFACLLTPMLPGVMRAAWDYQFADVMVASGTIEEMQPIFASVRGAAMISVVAVLIAIALAQWKRVRVGEWLWLGTSALLLLRLGRFAPIFAIIAAPVLAAALPALPDGVLSRRIFHLGAATALLLGVICGAILLPKQGTPMEKWLNRSGADAFGYPCGAAEFVRSNVRPTARRLINEFTWGGYLSWRLGDRYQVFVDGRTQLYTADFWRKTYLCDDTTRIKTLQRVIADAAVLPVRDSIFHDALIQLGWRRAYCDDYAEVMLPPESRAIACSAPVEATPASR